MQTSRVVASRRLPAGLDAIIGGERPIAAVAVIWFLGAPLVVDQELWLIVSLVALIGAGSLHRSLLEPNRRLRLWGTLAAAFVAAAAVSTAGGALSTRSGLAVLEFSLLPAGFLSAQRLARADLTKSLWLGSTVGAITGGIWAVVEVSSGNTDRADGITTNAIVFGDLVLILAFTSVALCPTGTALRRLPTRISLGALTLGVMASALSASRGGWLAAPLLVAVVLVRHRGSIHWRYCGLVGVVIVVAVLGAHLLGGHALDRLDAAVDQTREYVGTPIVSASHANSVGGRLDLWRSSFRAFRSEPLTGLGWGNLGAFFDMEAERGLVNDFAARHNHAHNQYLSAMANGGILGLAALVALFAVPARWFRVALHATDDRRRGVGGAGLVFIVGFGVSSLTEALLESTVALAFFAVAIPLLVGQLDVVPARLRASART